MPDTKMLAEKSLTTWRTRSRHWYEMLFKSTSPGGATHQLSRWRDLVVKDRRQVATAIEKRREPALSRVTTDGTKL